MSYNKYNWTDAVKIIVSKHSNIKIDIGQPYISSSTKLKYSCSEHGEKLGTLAYLLKDKYGCHECLLKENRKSELNKIIKQIESKFLNLIVIKKQEYINSNSNIKFRCIKHGEDSRRLVYLLKSKYGCTECYNINTKKSNWIRHIKEIESKFPSIKIPKNQEYNNLNTKIKFNCKDCGDKIARIRALKDNGCIDCNKNNKPITKSIFKINAELKHPNIKIIKDQSVTSSNCIVKFICKKHGQQEAKYFNFWSRQNPCLECWDEIQNEKQKLHFSNTINRIESKFPNILIPRNQKYINMYTKIKIICTKHKKMYKAKPVSLFYGACGCYDCASDNYSISGGWSRSYFIKSCKKSEVTPILYWIKMTYKNQSWYKFGRTKKGVKARFSGFDRRHGITYEIIKEVTGEPGYIYDLEKRIFKLYRKSKYKPPVKFGGDTECFKIVNLVPEKD